MDKNTQLGDQIKAFVRTAESAQNQHEHLASPSGAPELLPCEHQTLPSLLQATGEDKPKWHISGHLNTSLSRTESNWFPWKILMLKFFNKGHGTADQKTSSEFINLHLTWLNDFPPETPVQLQAIQHDYHFFLYLLYEIQLLIMFCFPTFLPKFLTDSFLLF